MAVEMLTPPISDPDRDRIGELHYPSDVNYIKRKIIVIDDRYTKNWPTKPETINDHISEYIQHVNDIHIDDKDATNHFKKLWRLADVNQQCQDSVVVMHFSMLWVHLEFAYNVEWNLWIPATSNFD